MILSKNDPHYQMCSISVMDNIADPDITFDNKGICNYYYLYKQLENENVYRGEDGKQHLNNLIKKIKKAGANRKYDCITGISGGVDSTYLIYKAKEWGLQPLIVHFDNGWDTEIAVGNINNIIQFTGFDLYTIVVNWNEFKDLQLAYIKASVVDIEVPTDHAISGTLQRLAAKYSVKYILSGNNVVCEAILPPYWIYDKNDHQNLLNIHSQFGILPLKTYPLFGYKERYYYGTMKNIQTVKPLNFIDYKYKEAKEIITREMNWRDYGAKHYESVFTKFYQTYILPRKFNIDKRKAHLSNLIFSGQISKEEALKELEKPLYADSDLQRDLEYVLKKFEISRDQFNCLMNEPRVEHSNFSSLQPLTEKYKWLKLLKPIKKLLYGNR